MHPIQVRTELDWSSARARLPNVIDPAVGTAIVQNLSGALEYFDNATTSGSLLQGYDQQQSRKVGELSTRITDSWLISF